MQAAVCVCMTGGREAESKESFDTGINKKGEKEKIFKSPVKLLVCRSRRGGPRRKIGLSSGKSVEIRCERFDCGADFTIKRSRELVLREFQSESVSFGLENWHDLESEKIFHIATRLWLGGRRKREGNLESEVDLFSWNGFLSSSFCHTARHTAASSV